MIDGLGTSEIVIFGIIGIIVLVIPIIFVIGIIVWFIKRNKKK